MLLFKEMMKTIWVSCVSAGDTYRTSDRTRGE
jgi:hypothetical protein